MNDIHDQAAGSGPASTAPKPSAYCQNCGRPLTDQTARIVGQAVFCEPCLAARLAGTPPPAGAGPQPGYAYVPDPGVPPGPRGPSVPNPGLAALLGCIPGVGAMYNEQYAKGIAHLFVFAVLVSLCNLNGIFGLFVAGWVFYMIIEAHHTAKARRDGTPLPNPFGFNDIGERFGFPNSFSSVGPRVSEVARDAAEAAAASFHSAATGFRPGAPPASGPAAPPEHPASHWGAPADAYGWQSPSGQPFPGQTQSQSQQPFSGSHGTQQPPHVPFQPSYAYAPPYNQTYSGPAYTGPVVPPVPPSAGRFPAGAVWLIGLGILFLLGTTGIFHGIHGGVLVGLILIGVAVSSFVKRMTCTGLPLADDGSPGYQSRLLRALLGSAWLFLFGFLIVLDGLHIERLRYSWPWILIVAGALVMLRRGLGSSRPFPAYSQPPVPPVPPVPPATPGRAPNGEPFATVGSVHEGSDPGFPGGRSV